MCAPVSMCMSERERERWGEGSRNLRARHTCMVTIWQVIFGGALVSASQPF